MTSLTRRRRNSASTLGLHHSALTPPAAAPQRRARVKTSAILHRVADFLKSFPPFSYLDADTLQTIAASGRVRFHESDEILFSIGDPCDSQLRVIQQGTIRLTRSVQNRERIVDLLGAGDIAGLGPLLGRTHREHTATTQTDTVIYALDLATVARACAASPKATQFLQIHQTATESEIDSPELDDTPTAALVARAFHACSVDDTLQTAAALLQREHLPALLVVDARGHPVGCVTKNSLRDSLAAGDAPAETPVSRRMQPAPPAITADTTLDACQRAMLRHDRRELCVTADGTLHSPATALLTEGDSLLWQGDNPTVIVRALARTRRLPALAALRHRVDHLLQSGLREFRHVDRCATLATEANRALLLRLTAFATAATTAVLGSPPPGDFCLALIGEAGRGEVLTPTGLESILILDRRAAEHDAWFATFADHLAADLAACGFAAPQSGLSPVDASCRLSVETWADQFRAWIASPIEHQILQRLPFFDFAPVQRNHPLAEKLRAAVRDSLAATPGFIRLLANDCFESLPPLTIIEGYAVDAHGIQTEELALQAHATQPVADVARVFQLATGDISITSTLERLARAQQASPAAAPIFVHAARAFRIALACRATVGLATGSDGARILPARLSRTEQALLKSGFPAIAALLDHAARAHGFTR